MGFFTRMFGIGRSQPQAAQSSQLHSQNSSGMSVQLAQSQNTTRRELLRVVLRDTLNRHGIPVAWITAELLSATSRGGERGIHWRLHIKHWDARLMECSVSLQNALIKRVLTFDPLATNWLNGISWQLSLDDESMCPPLPNATTWAMHQRAAEPAPAKADPVAGDIIEGPVHIGATAKAVDARADLDQLLAARDADFDKHSDGKTKPVFAATEPAKL
ncbi:MAG TPA: hypothetical protein VMZ74_08120 [Ramlibacter sp.]|nr:hypothetical protein [Ramlibacter sp.]